MGNCNCFDISQQEKSVRNKDFIIDNKESLVENYGDLNKPYDHNEKTTTIVVYQKLSPRGANNPTQKPIKQNIIANPVLPKDNKESKPPHYKNIEKTDSQNKTNKKRFSIEKHEDSTEKDFTNNYDSFNSNSLNKKITKNDKSDVNKESNTMEENSDLSNTANIIFNKANSTNLNENSFSNINRRLTDNLKLKDLSKNMKEKPNTINITLLGDKCVGKTSIVYQYLSNKFDQYYIQTIRKEEFTKTISINNKSYSVNFIVTSGVPQYQEDYSTSYKNSDFFVVCYDVTLQSSFEKAKEIITKELIPYVFLYNYEYANIVLLGNKCDSKERKVDSKAVAEYCKKYNIDFNEVSAKKATNISKVFNKIFDVFDETMNLVSKINLK